MTKLIDVLTALDATIARPFGLHISIDGTLVPLEQVTVEEYGDFILMTRVVDNVLIVSRLISRNLFDLVMVRSRLTGRDDAPMEARAPVETELAPVNVAVKGGQPRKHQGAQLALPDMSSMLGAVLGPGVKGSIL